jgi:hypothetical protein
MMTDVRLDEAAVVVDGDLRVDTGSIRTRSIAALSDVSGNEVKAQVLVVNGALRATNVFAARDTASVPVEAASIALDHPTAPRLKRRPPIATMTGRDAAGSETALRKPVEPSPGPTGETMDPIPRRLALTHVFGAGTDRLVLNHQRRYAQGVHVDGDLVVGGAVSQASSALLKRDIETLPVDEAARAIGALRPVRYRYRADEAGRRHAGFIAEEVAEVIPDAEDDQVRPLDLIAMLTAVVQDQQRAIAALTDEVAALGARQ